MNKDSSYLGRLFVGTVVVNASIDQSLGQGEVKVYVPELYDSNPDLIPVALHFRNDCGGAQSFGVLSIGRQVILELQDGDPQCPIVRCSILTPGMLPSEFVADYPNVYGWADETGNLFLVNKATGMLRFTNAAGFSATLIGTSLTISSGIANIAVTNATLNISGNTDITTQGNTTIATTGTTSIQSTGAATVHSTGNLNLQSDVKVVITAPLIEEN